MSAPTDTSLYSKAVLTKRVSVKFVQIGIENLNQIFHDKIALEVEKKCISHGYVKKGSVNILSHAGGELSGDSVIYVVRFECLVFLPSVGMILDCVAISNTFAGIRSKSSTDEESPFELFVARDYSFAEESFNSIKEGDKFKAEVIEHRFELNDNVVYIIASLVN